MLERLPDFTRAAERWLEELGSGRRGAEREAEEALRDAQAQEAQAAAGIERLNRRYALEDDPASPKAEALLDVLVAQRQEHARAQRRAEQALEDLAAIRRTLSGDVLLVAQRSLEEALASGATTALADFNRRLREHFEGVLVLETGEAIPLWKVAIPTAAPAIGELSLEDAYADISARIASLGDDPVLAPAGAPPLVPGPEYNSQGSQEPSPVGSDYAVRGSSAAAKLSATRLSSVA